jgi:hypothetical protein
MMSVSEFQLKEFIAQFAVIVWFYWLVRLFVENEQKYAKFKIDHEVI